MTDDLVKRLREVKDWWREPGRTAEQAADRIEALEAALDELLTYQVASEAAARNVDELARIMQKHRAALGEKKDD
jgi:RPA family protein